MPKVVGIYTRVSHDRDGTNTSTDRQERLCREWTGARDWTVGAVFCDNDRSAFKAGERRPEFERLLAWAAMGRIDAIVCWRLDRLTRQPRELERVWSICEQSGTTLASVTEPVDSSTPTGLTLVRLLVTFAGLESQVRSERLRARARERAELGFAAPNATGYGHTRGFKAVVGSEAVLIREASHRLLEGDGLSEIVDDWGARGIVGRRGVPWTRSGLKNLLLAHRLVGDCSLHGVVVAQDCFPPILDRLTAARVRHVLSATVGVRKRSGALLRGLVRCGLCGRTMTPMKSREDFRYGCRAAPRGGCNRVSAKAVPVDEWI